MSWRPVLHGDLAAAARQAVTEIADTIDRVPPAQRSPADVALFRAYVTGPDDAAGVQQLEAAVAVLIGSIDRGELRSLALHGGLIGAGWVLSHISDGDIEGLAALDDMLIAELVRDVPRTYDHDLISGIAGHAIYFLERLASGAPAAAAGLAHAVGQLRALAVDHADGLTWFTPAARASASSVSEAPNGRYDCGVAHGVPGVISALARLATAAGVDERTAADARRLASRALAWMRVHLLPPHPRGRVAPWVLPVGEQSPGPPGSAWCYGEPGAAVALWAAAHRLGEPTDVWRELARDSARRSIDDSDVNTPGLCHGAAGLAHLFNRCYQASGDALFATATQRWVEQTLAMKAPASEPVPFTLSGSGNPSVPSQLLLFGATGIGLGLAAALTAVEPGWDRLLACDLPLPAV